MHGAIPSLSKYTFMAWCLIKQGTILPSCTIAVLQECQTVYRHRYW